jgi:hypothetical protein
MELHIKKRKNFMQCGFGEFYKNAKIQQLLFYKKKFF